MTGLPSALPDRTAVSAVQAVAAALFAVDPVGLGGVVWHGGAGGGRDAWLALLRGLLPAAAPWRRLPLHADAERLLGGLDLTATLQAGRPVAQRGLLAEADGGVVLLPMAERLAPTTAALVAAVLDARQVVVEREGLGQRNAAHLGIVAFDESLPDEPALAASLQDRLAFRLSDRDRSDPADPADWQPADIAAARARLGTVQLADDVVEGLCAAALALGIASVRAPLLACRAARAAAALDGRDTVTGDDVALAAALVLAPRATRVPASAGDAAADDGAPAEPPRPVPPDGPDRAPDDDATGNADAARSDAEAEAAAVPDRPLDEQVLAAALAAVPAGLLASLAAAATRAPPARSAGRAGALQHGGARGRPVGARRGEPRDGARLHLVETLRAAAPWQLLRRREAAAAGRVPVGPVLVRRDDLHVWRLQQRSETVTVFAVDASGSSALHRLAEAKGAVELLLADCYVRRDSVAVIAFRGTGAELLLPPTRSLLRAKRSLAGLPGGGGTPLAAGLDAAADLAGAVRRRGAQPVVVLLTDGRANIARDGMAGRTRAADDASAAARRLRHDGVAALLLDTSPQPQDAARRLAADMGARYLPLPHADAHAVSRAVRAATAASAEAARAAR